jgi:hypothetical protein
VFVGIGTQIIGLENDDPSPMSPTTSPPSSTHSWCEIWACRCLGRQKPMTDGEST